MILRTTRTLCRIRWQNNTLARAPRRFQTTEHQPSHVTYFQQPPESGQPRQSKLIWRVLRGTLIGFVSFSVGVFGGHEAALKQLSYSRTRPHSLDSQYLETMDREIEHAAAIDRMQAMRARHIVTMNEEGATILLNTGAGTTVSPGVIGHSCQLASNLPCEDEHFSHYIEIQDADTTVSRKYDLFGVIDGHAGAHTSNIVAALLPQFMSTNIANLGEMAEDDNELTKAVVDSFIELDGMLLNSYMADNDMIPDCRARRTSEMVYADEGSCALIAVHDQQKNMLHIANLGDSRAVLGRWDPQQRRYKAMALSKDHTGFNEDEIRRIEAEHPGEDVIDKSTGRVFGLAVTRAFGDSRWKFPESKTRHLHEQYYAKPPRPNGVVRTPPYITAEPEITTVNLQLGEKPDFLVMASDGLWDLLSSEQAVELVQSWLDVHDPQNKGLHQPIPAASFDFLNIEEQRRKARNYVPDASDADLYYDKRDKVMKWRNSSKHFVVKDHHAGVHLIRNALGGKRSDLFHTLCSVPQARSRDVRDDITASVIFFGQDTREMEQWRDQQMSQQALQQESASVR